MAEIVVDVSARLKVLQSSVTEIQKVLDKLQPNSSGFKVLSNIIENIKKDMDKLLLLTSKPFGSQALFNQAEKSIDKIDESLGKAQLAIQRIQFSDLLLDSSQLALFDALATKLKDIENNFKQVKEAAKMDMFSNEDFSNFANSINPDLINKSFDEVVKAIENKNNKINESLALSLRNIEKYNQTMSTGVKVKDFISGGFLQKGLGTDVFDEFLKKTENGLQFKKGKKDAFYQYMKETFSLTPALMAEIAGKSANELLEYLSKALDKRGNSTFFSKLLKALATAEKNYIEELGGLGLKKAEAEAAAQAMRVYRAEMVEVNKAEAEAVTKTEQTTGEIRELESSCVNAAKGSASLKNGFNLGQTALDLFRQQLAETNVLFLKLLRSLQTFNSMKIAIANFMGFNLVLNITKRAVQEAMNHIKELDSVMNGIAIVTDMSTGDLWNQVDAYSDMALKYGVTIQGAYDVSKIYYQQGLETADVMTLTNETLKLSKISGLDYATTTDYMTTAIRGFKMEMSEASTVVDVYSALAANTAVSLQELAEAMTRTASSMEGVGTTFLDASAMIATIVAVTRESANNIGSAMKSIASRYGELTKDPAKLVDSEGEAMSFNRVDTALQSVGISMKTAEGQFRDFTSVIVELAEKWNTLESTQQRYIATLFAGNRQQSRFLALVSNADLLKANMDVAANSEDTGTLQALKALDSIESKINLVLVAYQQFYTTVGAENIWKGFLDGAKNVINTLNGLPKLFGKIPVAAITVIMSGINTIKNLVLTGLATVANSIKNVLADSTTSIETANNNAKLGGQKWTEKFAEGIRERLDAVRAAKNMVLNQTNPDATATINQDLIVNYSSKFLNILDLIKGTINYYGINSSEVQSFIPQLQDLYLTLLNVGFFSGQELPNDLETLTNKLNEVVGSSDKAKAALELLNKSKSDKLTYNFLKLSSTFTQLGSGLNMIALLFNNGTRAGLKLSGALQIIAGLITGIGAAILGLSKGSWIGLAFTAITMVVNGISTAIETTEERIERLTKEAEELNNKAKETKANYNILERSKKKLEELAEKRYETTEAAEEYLTAIDDLTSKFPELIAGFDSAGNVILSTSEMEAVLTAAREKSALATYEAAEAELEASKERLKSNKDTIEADFRKLGIGDRKIFAGSDELGQNVKDKFKTFWQTYDNTDIDWIDEKLSSVDVETAVKKAAINSLQESLWSKYMETVLDEVTGLYNYSFSSYALYLKSLKDSGNVNNSLVNDILALADVYFGNNDISKVAEVDEAIDKFNSSLSADEIITNYNSLMTLLNELLSTEEGIAQFGEAYGIIYELLKGLSKDIDKANAENTLYKAYSKQTISAWQNTLLKNTKLFSYLDENSLLALFTINSILNEIDKNYSGDWKKYKEEMAGQIPEIIKFAEEFWKELGKQLNGDELKEKFNKMVTNSQYFSGQDIVGEFDTLPSELAEEIKNSYLNSSDAIKKNILSNLAQKLNVTSSENLQALEEYINIITDLEGEALQLTSSDLQYFSQLTDLIKSLEDKGFQNLANDVLTRGTDLFDTLLSVPYEYYTDIKLALLNNGLYTKEGIQKTMDLIMSMNNFEGLDALWTLLSDLRENIISNFYLSITSAIQDFTNNWSDASKNIKKITEGIDLTEVLSMIDLAKSFDYTNEAGEKFALTFTDFKTSGDKLVLSAQKANEYWIAYSNSMEALANKAIAEIDLALQNLNGGKEATIETFSVLGIDWSNSENRKWAASILGSDYSKYFDASGLLSGITNTQLLAAFETGYNKIKTEVNNYLLLIQWAQLSVLKTTLWNLGDYSSLLDLLGENWSSTFITALKEGVSVLQRIDSPDLKNAVDKAQSAYNSLISDVLSKGFKNINLADYEGLLDLGKRIELSGSYQDFVKKYVDFAGKTIEETNALIAQAIEKDKATERSADDIVKNFKFIDSNTFTASLDDLQNLANTFGKNIDDWIKQGVAEWDSAAQAYKVNKSAIDINWKGIENIQDIIQDSINEYINALVDSISKGISGKLSRADKTNLESSLANLGITNLNLDFTKTEEGLKLSLQSAIALYNELRKIDSIQSKLVFDDLRKSLEDNNENYLNVSSIMAHIKDLQEKINTANKEKNSAKVELYEQELAIAKEILAVRSQTDDDSFKFMDQALPGGQNNPLNYYDAMNKANKAISDAFNMKEGGGKGYMGYQDFYNIVTQINQMAAVSKQKIKIGAYTLSGNMLDAADLIEAGASALASVDGGEMKVNLGLLGIDMLTGASLMRNGLNSGLKTMAQEQIKMLDAAIAMLEAIVAIQEIGDLGDIHFDLGVDGVFDPSDLFSEEGMETAQKYLDQIALWTDISIDGKGLGAALSDLAKNGEEGAQKVFEFFQELNKMLTDPDFDFSNFSTDFNNLLAKTFDGKKIDISLGIFSNLGISSTDMGKSLYKRISDAYTKTTKDPNIINNLIKDIGKKNKDLAKNLLAALKAAGKGASFSAIMEIAEKIQSKSKIEEDTKNNTVTAKYGKNSKTFNGKNAKILAQNWIASEAQKEAENAAKSTKNNKFKPPVLAVRVEGSAEVAYMTETSDGKWLATYHGVKMTAGSPDELKGQLEIAISEWANGTGGFTYEFANKKKVTVKMINGIEYRQYINENGETTHYIMNGKVYKNVTAFLRFLEEKAKTDTNANVTIGDDGNTINVTTNSRAQYKIKVDADGNVHYYIGNAEYTKKLLDKYLEELAAAKANGSNISITKNPDHKETSIITVTTSSGILYKITVEPNGAIKYLYNDKEYTAELIDMLVKATDLFGKDNIIIDEGGTITANINGKEFKIKYNVEKKEYDFGGYTGKTLQEAINNYNEENSDNQVNSGDKGSEIKIEDGTVVITPDKVVLANISENGEIALTENLTAITGHAKELLVTYDKLVDGGKAAAGNGEGAAEGSKAADFELSYAVTASTGTLEVDASTAEKKLKEGQTVTVQLLNADGTATNLTITKITGDKTAADVTDVEAGAVEATASSIELSTSEENYHLKFEKIDAEGNVEISSEINIPAKLLFGDQASLTAYLASQTDLSTPEINVILSDIQKLITENGPYEAEVTAKYGANGGGLRFADYKEKFLEFLDTGTGNFSKDENNIYTDRDSGYQWTVSMTGQIKLYIPSEEEPEPVEVEPEFDVDSVINNFISRLADEEFNLSAVINSDSINTDELLKALGEKFADTKVGVPMVADTDEFRNFIEQNLLQEQEVTVGAIPDVNSFTKVANELNTTVPSNKDITASVVDNTSTGIANVNSSLEDLPKNKTIYANIVPRVSSSASAKGNVALASGNAMASGTKTLMGELGPELVVSHGRYFVVGLNGAEFVDLDKDAIVFNHLQTKSLLKNGKAGRGKAKTNERNAVGMATGNVSGPALASAQAALANLRQIRAMWESLLSASVQDIAQKGGGGGGGGGKKENNAAWLADVERWYNWLQRIAQLEKDINYEETLRSKILSDRNVNGKAYVDSLVRLLEATKEEEKYLASLADSLEAYFKKRRKEMNNSAFSKFYTFDEGGQLKYTEKSKLKNGDKGGFTALSDLMATNPDGSTKYTAEQQYNKIKAWGFGNTMLYDSSGKKITDENKKKGKHSDEFFTQSVQAFWDKIESDKEEMQKLRDSIDDANTKVLEMEQKRNELIKEMRDNLMDLEDKIMDALQNKLQSKIDEMLKKRDAYDKANQKFIKGLQDSLARELDMYLRQEDKTELSKMRRLLAILQRSGGSASSIASLQNDIREKEKDLYFDERQAQIDAIQTASDKQLEKMDLLISIAQETLDYLKRMGLLWNEVYKIMGGSEGSILKYLQTYSADFTSLSTLGLEDLTGQWKALIEEYKRWQQKLQDNEVGQKWNVAKDAIKQSKLYSKVYGTGYEYTNSKGEKVNVDKAAKAEFERIYKNTGDENKARQAATKVYSDALKQYEKENSVKKQSNKSSDKNNDKNSSKNGNNSKKTTAQLGRYLNKDGKTTFIGWYTLKAGLKTPSAPTISGYKCTNTNSTVPSSGAIAGKTYKVTYTYSKTTALHGWVVTGTDKNNKRIRQEFSLKNYKDDYSAAIAALNWINKNKSKAKGTLSMSRYKRGGQVDYTGLAQVDGTPSRPEAFFNAEQTKILKKGLLGNSSRILASALEEFNSIVASMANGATYNTIDRGSSLVIENASVNMNVQSIANDYDARRAGEQALEQMMRIARKSGTKGVSRR